MRTDRQGNNVATPVPVWILAPHEEKQVRAICQEETNKKCAKQFWKMGKCTSEHQILFSWYCAAEKKELLDCVAYWGSHEQYEILRQKYIEDKRKELINEGKL